MSYHIAVLPGDGIGPEVIGAARRVLDVLPVPLVLTEAEAGFGTFQRVGSALPAETLALCEQSDAVLFGATGSPLGRVEGYTSPILALRRHFDLYANLRPAGHMLIVRENSEGLYSGIEREQASRAVTERVITEAASRRIVRRACEHTRQHLTIVHKANVLKATCGLFRRVAFEVVEDFPKLQVEEMLVDTCALRMVQTPEHFEVIVTTNLFGDILSDLAAGLVGGLGLVPSANLGEGHPALFEPVHGSAPDIAGQGIADPRAAILSAALMLRFLGEEGAACRLETAVSRVNHHGNTRRTTASIIQEVTHAAP